jgi:hypothetical protein
MSHSHSVLSRIAGDQLLLEQRGDRVDDVDVGVREQLSEHGRVLEKGCMVPGRGVGPYMNE